MTIVVPVLILVLVVIPLLVARAARRWSRRDLRSTVRHHRALDTLAVLAGGQGGSEGEVFLDRIGGHVPVRSDGDDPDSSAEMSTPARRGSPWRVRVIGAPAGSATASDPVTVDADGQRPAHPTGPLSASMLAPVMLPAAALAIRREPSVAEPSVPDPSVPDPSAGRRSIDGRRLVTLEELGSVPLSPPRTSIALTVTREETSAGSVGGVRVIPAGFSVPGAGSTIPAVRLLTGEGSTPSATPTGEVGAEADQSVPMDPVAADPAPAPPVASSPVAPSSVAFSPVAPSPVALSSVVVPPGAPFLTGARRVLRSRLPHTSQQLVARATATAAALVLVVSVVSVVTHHGSSTLPVISRTSHVAAKSRRPAPAIQRVATAPPVSVPVRLIASNSTTATYRLTGSSPVTLEATGDCWVDVHQGGETGPSVLTTTLVPGQEESFSGPVWMRLGDPTAVTIQVGTSSVPAAQVTAGQPYDLDFQ